MRLEQEGLNFTVIPERHLRTMVWIHGYADTGELFAKDFLESPLIPDCKVILPTAPLVGRPGEQAHSWYERAGNKQLPPSIEPSASRIVEILQEERKYTDSLYIGGFSQGAVMSLYVGLNKYPGEIKAIIALSGFVMPFEISQQKKNTPVLMYHGAQDNRISVSSARETSQMYLGGVDLTFEVHPTMPHEVYLEEYEYIRNWVTRTF